MSKAKEENPCDRNELLKYRGSITKQSVEEVDNQLQELRNEWERDLPTPPSPFNPPNLEQL